MATDIVGSLFGVSPEMYQQQMNRQAMQDAIAMQQLSPLQRAGAMTQAGAYMAGQGIGSALGVEDPMLKIISARQQVGKTIDFTNPESIANGIRQLSNIGDTQGAGLLAQEGRKAMESAALVAQRIAAATRERQQAVPAAIQVANELANLDLASTQVSAMPDSPEKSEALRRIRVRTDALQKQSKEFAPTEIQKLQEYRASLVSGGASQDQIAEVDAIIKALPGRGKTTITNILGSEKIASIPDFRNTVRQTIKPQIDVITATDQALNQLDLSVSQNNPAAFNAARLQLARAIGGSGDISNKEIQAAGGDPSLYGRLVDTTSTLFTGTPTLETQKNIQNTLKALQTVAKKKANDEIGVQVRLGVESKIGSENQLKQAFDFPELRDGGAGVPSDLAAQAAAILQQRQAKPR
jgi:hypothetical protein